MSRMRKEYIEKIYAGWLAKIIGIRLGAPVEGWSSKKIRDVYGRLTGYAVKYNRFAADDDSNGPLFFIRALEDSGKKEKLCSEDVAEALLNYVPFEHGFFWWGGYGCSTEHTAYLNLHDGIPAPRSGSIRQNGRAVAEQIGGQIFIDSWGLVAPGNPDLAAKLAREAAGVTHGGDGIHGGIFIAACISAAFEEKNIISIIEKGLSYLPEESGYYKIVKEVMRFYMEHPGTPESCLEYIQEHYGYDKYPGNCHIIPNTAVIILALLYGNGDFSETLNICNRCGWDTDCNVGNVAVIMGVRGGLSVISQALREPINDFVACSSVIGSLNNQDIPYGACYMIKQAWNLAGEELPEPFGTIIETRIDSCHFEFSGSTHAFLLRNGEEKEGKIQETVMVNTDEAAHTGKRSLKLSAGPAEPGGRIFAFKKTYLRPADFHDSRYDPAFSPLVYPGQEIHGSAFLPGYGVPCRAALYVRNAETQEIYSSSEMELKAGMWQELDFKIPAMQGVLLDEAGFVFTINPEQSEASVLTVMVDDFYVTGAPEYTIDFSKERVEYWTPVHKEISQFTRLKGQFCLEEGRALISCSDYAECYTGHHGWKDYEVTAELEPVIGDEHYVAVRVEGAVRSYLAGFRSDRTFAVMKKTRQGMIVLGEIPCEWEHGQTYRITVNVTGNRILAKLQDTVLTVLDQDRPYLAGCIGLAVREGSSFYCRSMEIKSAGDKEIYENS